MSEIEFENLPEEHPIRKFCAEYGIEDEYARQALCDMVRGVVTQELQREVMVAAFDI